VLAMNPYYGYYQLGFWTGDGPLHTFKVAQRSPMALSPGLDGKRCGVATIGCHPASSR
jgi:hypothetical protein